MATYDAHLHVWRQTFYDTAASLTAKYTLAKSRGLAGVGMWALGYDTGASRELAGPGEGLPAAPAEGRQGQEAHGPPREAQAKAEGHSQAQAEAQAEAEAAQAGAGQEAHRRLTRRTSAEALGADPPSPGPVTPADPARRRRLGLSQNGPSRTPASDTDSSSRPRWARIASRISDPAGRNRARVGLIAWRSAADDDGSLRRTSRAASRRCRSSRRSSIAAGRTLTRFEAVPPTAISSADLESREPTDQPGEPPRASTRSLLRWADRWLTNAAVSRAPPTARPIETGG